ncbi:TetR/AcrR family transcriptional regulator [Acinetobacter oleivorans]|uniref:TetR/AcrR family transcriptional regulator n=1 Tax=Acinetobacter oleivorans TaxID=1148157 RepID=UPI0018FF472C|nr:TetR/AcrR family transcriptional regulator [Acinetobacter oleivorans]MBJ9419705.1 TetR/AcrR family transcriptional regulator [Acinetobacter oleivorans]
MSKKDDIINTALRLFNSYSYNSIGVDRIINESGVAKMTFYKHFPSKEKLIEECLLLRNTLLQNSLTSALSEHDELDPLARIKAVFLWYSDWFNSEDFNGCMFQKALEEVLKQYPSTHQPATLYKAWLTQLMQNLLNQYDVKEPGPLSLLLVNILEGMTIQAQVEHGSIKIYDYWNRVEKLIDFERAA